MHRRVCVCLPRAVTSVMIYLPILSVSTRECPSVAWGVPPTGAAQPRAGERPRVRSRADTVRPYLGENPGCASGHMSGAVVDLVCSDQLSRGLRAWQARSRHATGERIGDCDLMRSTSASCARQRWSGNARSMTSVKRAARTALSVVVVLFDHHKSLRNHRDTRTLEQFAILSRTISVRHERRTSTQREAARTRANQSPVEKCTARTFMK